MVVPGEPNKNSVDLRIDFGHPEPEEVYNDDKSFLRALPIFMKHYAGRNIEISAPSPYMSKVKFNAEAMARENGCNVHITYSDRDFTIRVAEVDNQEKK